MCNMCRHNHVLVLAAMLAGSTEPVEWKKKDPTEPDRAIDPEPLRVGLATVLRGLGMPYKRTDAEAAARERVAGPARMQAAFANLTNEQIADLGRLTTDTQIAFEAVSQLGIVELQRRRDAGDETAGAELESSIVEVDEDTPQIHIHILDLDNMRASRQQPSAAAAEPNFPH